MIESVNRFADAGGSLPWSRRPSARWARRWARALLVACVLAGPSLLAPACRAATASRVAELGSTNLIKTSTGPTETGKLAASLAYSRCMRVHGLPNFPDPKQVAGGGIQISGSQAGMNPDSPLFLSAEASCGYLLPGGGRSRQAGQQQERARMLHSSLCMRAHGISGFPDPSLSPPSSRAGESAIMSNDGVWLAIPGSIDIRSRAFERAAAACSLGLS